MTVRQRKGQEEGGGGEGVKDLKLNADQTGKEKNQRKKNRRGKGESVSLPDNGGSRGGTHRLSELHQVLLLVVFPG